MDKQGVYVIAEAGVNHNGSLELAFRLIDAAVEAGANAVKFQTFKAENLVTSSAPKAEYQTVNTDSSESQFQMLKKLELNEHMHDVLLDYACKKGIDFLSTPFDVESLCLLVNRYNLPLLKIPSGEITNAPFLLEVAKTQKPIILSTGMSHLSEIENALGVLAFGYLGSEEVPSINGFQQAFSSERGQAILKEKVKLLHCTTEYPAPFDEVNLRAMDTLRTAFGLEVGYSDHTVGIAVPIAAVARGAVIIEKHFTIDRSLPGPDHKASLEPDELFGMVQSIRQIQSAMGEPLKFPTVSELKNRIIARKSIVARRDISSGEMFTVENLAIKRPGTGLSPYMYWSLLGTKADRDYKKDEVFSCE